MSEDPQADAERARLPKELVDRLTKPFAWFLRIEAASGAVLLLFTVAALVLSNSPWAHVLEGAWETPVGLQLGSLEFARSLRDWINDGLMALFIANLAFSQSLIDAAKLGIFVASGVSAVAGVALLAWLRPRTRGGERPA